MTTGNPLSMEEILAGVKAEGQEKTASDASRGMSHEDVSYAQELALLDKVAQDMSQDELLKIAASAKLTGEIMSEIQLEKLANELPGHLLNKLAGPIVQLVQASVMDVLHKVAVGDNPTITGHTREVQPDGDPQRAAIVKDQQGQDAGASMADGMAHANVTQGAQASGGSPESHQGEHITSEQGDTVKDKVSSNMQAYQLAQILHQAGYIKQANEMMGYGVGDPGGMPPGGAPPMGGAPAAPSPEEEIQQLLQMKAAGQPLTPEQEQKLAMALSQQGGGGAPAPGPGGGMEVQASARVNGVADFIRSRLLQ